MYYFLSTVKNQYINIQKNYITKRLIFCIIAKIFDSKKIIFSIYIIFNYVCIKYEYKVYKVKQNYRKTSCESK